MSKKKDQVPLEPHPYSIELFKTFKTKFPPAHALKESELRMTTGEVIESITGFTGDPGITVQFIFDQLLAAGYKYEPVEYNDKVTFYWLFKKPKAEENH